MQLQSFEELGVHPALLRALVDEGYTVPTPIQLSAIPHLLTGRDLLGCAQTGTGKTAAFAIPILQRLSMQPRRVGPGGVRALVLTPTRELAIQIAGRVAVYGSHLTITSAVIFGGVSQHHQVRALARGVDILIATPGRLLDLLGQGLLRLDGVEIFVLDEADRMLDMGFIHDVKRVISQLPTNRQTLLFSATMPNDIADLAQKILRSPLHVAVNPVSSTVDRIVQRVLMVEKPNKPALLSAVLANNEIERALVFTRTKHGADKVAKWLAREKVEAMAIHGNKSQGARQRALECFRNGQLRVLVATDIAARGIDVPGITHVINFDLPNESESYVHRIGRTARAGKEGMAISFCAADERPFLRDIEKLIRQSVMVIEGHPFESTVPQEAPSHTVKTPTTPRHPLQPHRGSAPARYRGPSGYGRDGDSERRGYAGSRRRR